MVGFTLWSQFLEELFFLCNVRVPSPRLCAILREFWCDWDFGISSRVDISMGQWSPKLVPLNWPQSLLSMMYHFL